MESSKRRIHSTTKPRKRHRERARLRMTRLRVYSSAHGEKKNHERGEKPFAKRHREFTTLTRNSLVRGTSRNGKMILESWRRRRSSKAKSLKRGEGKSRQICQRVKARSSRRKCVKGGIRSTRSIKRGLGRKRIRRDKRRRNRRKDT